ncbi:TfoX/Sxy family DNA transformation protein [Enterococcus ureilyticus]|nr:hypothetical protein [Enterococcus ureilyticus]
MESKLKSIGISTAEELQEKGVKSAYLKLKMRYSNICLVHLYLFAGGN